MTITASCQTQAVISEITGNGEISGTLCSKLASADRVVGDWKIVSQCAAATFPDHILVPISTTGTPPMITLQAGTLEEGAVH